MFASESQVTFGKITSEATLLTANDAFFHVFSEGSVFLPNGSERGLTQKRLLFGDFGIFCHSKFLHPFQHIFILKDILTPITWEISFSLKAFLAPHGGQMSQQVFFFPISVNLQHDWSMVRVDCFRKALFGKKMITWLARAKIRAILLCFWCFLLVFWADPNSNCMAPIVRTNKQESLLCDQVAAKTSLWDSDLFSS